MPIDPASASHLSQFRSVLRARGVDYWLQPINDEFQGEYVPGYAERLPWLSGFHGSAGMGIIAAREEQACGLLVDGRYTVQAVQDVEPALWAVSNSAQVSIAQWLADNADAGSVIGYDAWLHTQNQAGRLAALLEARGFTFMAVMENPVDAAWNDRPVAPQGEVELYPEALAGQSVQEKTLAVSRFLDESELDGLVITQPDAVAWLLNIRGSDIPYNPLLLAYAIVLRDGRIILLTHPRAFPDAVLTHFAANKVELFTFGEWFGGAGLLNRLGLGGARLGIDTTLAAHAWWIWAERVALELYPIDDPVQHMKAVKYPTEQEAMREAHRRDAVSFAHFLSQLPARLSARLGELDIVAMLEEARSADNGYRGPSFATIAGTGPNGAIVHYHATEQSNRHFLPGEILLLDSGGQYLEGTTDITRMIPFGAVSKEICDRYTRVLKGHIALASARFPAGTTGRQLDALARQYLWDVGCDYDHGTGHGVGTYLCVHEGPQRISKKGSDVPLEPGMVISNEPGYYKEGEYGIRIENLVMVVPTELPGTLCFETITLVPIDTSLIDKKLLRGDELAWLNAYHHRIYEIVGPRVRDDATRAWLAQACAPI